ncbi:hypothetical protein BaRGS_00000808, partial [Batillaria attramentaria]
KWFAAQAGVVLKGFYHVESRTSSVLINNSGTHPPPPFLRITMDFRYSATSFLESWGIKYLVQLYAGKVFIKHTPPKDTGGRELDQRGWLSHCLVRVK